jgi:uncharacterized protein involved in type VI secretion and phage assembly
MPSQARYRGLREARASLHAPGTDVSIDRQANYRIDLTQALRQRSLCTQYRESDLGFISRLLAEEGLSYHFEHLGGSAAHRGAWRGSGFEATTQGRATVRAACTESGAAKPRAQGPRA